MNDIITLIEKVKRKRNSSSVKRAFSCETCKKTMIKFLPPLYNPENVKCSCGCEMKMI